MIKRRLYFQIVDFGAEINSIFLNLHPLQNSTKYLYS